MKQSFEVTKTISIEAKLIPNTDYVVCKVEEPKEKNQYGIITKDEWEKGNNARVYNKKRYQTKKIMCPYAVGHDFNQYKGKGDIFPPKASDHMMWPVMLSDEVIETFKETGHWLHSPTNKKVKLKDSEVFNRKSLKDFDLYFINHYNHTMYDKDMTVVVAPFADVIVCSGSYNLSVIRKAIEEGKLIRTGEDYYCIGNGDTIPCSIPMTQEEYEKYISSVTNRKSGWELMRERVKGAERKDDYV